MSNVLRIMLLIGSLGTAVIIIRKIRKCRIKQEDTLFWICFAALLAILGIFPELSYALSSLIGIISPANFVFLVIIVLLVEKMLSLSIQVSMLEKNVAEMAAELAIRTKDINDRATFNEDKTKNKEIGKYDAVKNEEIDTSAAVN